MLDAGEDQLGGDGGEHEAGDFAEDGEAGLAETAFEAACQVEQQADGDDGSQEGAAGNEFC